jgi:flagellar FliJ protein
MQSFLNLRVKLEDQRKLEYGQALARLEEEKQKKLRMAAEKRDRMTAMRESIIKRVDPELTQRYNNYFVVLDNRIARQTKEIEKAEKTAEEKRVMLIEAMKDRKMMETLRDKAREEYIIEEKGKEQKVTDEIVSYRGAQKAADT